MFVKDEVVQIAAYGEREELEGSPKVLCLTREGKILFWEEGIGWERLPNIPEKLLTEVKDGEDERDAE